MKIVHVFDGHDRVFRGSDSVETVVWNVAKHSADLSHEVTVIERRWEGLSELGHRDGVHFRRLELQTGSNQPREQIPFEMVESVTGATQLAIDRTNFALATLNMLQAMEYDVIHVHHPFAANVLVTIAPWLRSRMVYTAHLGATKRRVEEMRPSPDVYLASRAAKTMVLNAAMKRAFERRGVLAERLTVVPNGVDIDRFKTVSQDKRRKVRETYDLTGEVIALFVGTITPRKGVADLVAAARDLVTDGRDDVQFVVAGTTKLDEEYVADVQSTVDDSGVESAVRFTGFVPDEHLLALYDIADIFVLPSYEEGFSIAVNEAMSAGLPVVGSDIEGMRQQIDHGDHGLLADPGDVDGLRANLEEIVADPDEREAMSRAATRRAERLSWGRVVPRILDVYRNAIPALSA